MKTLYLFLEDEYVGNIYVEDNRLGESFSFSFSDDFLKRKKQILIDPELFNYSGRQYSKSGVFGFINDMIPDRFGKMLIDHIEEKVALLNNENPRKLKTSEYLLKVNDLSRMGAFRIKEKLDGPFVNEDKDAIPPYIYLRDIENASIEIESKDEVDEEVYNKLLLPGSSLGGARPKASVYYGDEVYIAKFPSKKDDYDVELLEYIVCEIAKKCGLNVPITKLEKYSNLGHTLLIKRFDRNGNKRIHYISAVTALAAKDGESNDYSYIDLVDFIKANCINITKNLEELYKRVVFTYLINNTDNHLRNHAFILKDGNYELAPMFDVNPTLYRTSFELSAIGVSMNKDSILASSIYYDLTYEKAEEIYEMFSNVIKEELEKAKNKYSGINKEIDRILGILSNK